MSSSSRVASTAGWLARICSTRVEPERGRPTMKIGSGAGSPQPARSAKNSRREQRLRAADEGGGARPGRRRAAGAASGVGAGVVRRRPRRSGRRPRRPWRRAKCSRLRSSARQRRRSGERLIVGAVGRREAVGLEVGQAHHASARAGSSASARRNGGDRLVDAAERAQAVRRAPARPCGWSGKSLEQGGGDLGGAGVVAESRSGRAAFTIRARVLRGSRASSGSSSASASAVVPRRCSTRALATPGEVQPRRGAQTHGPAAARRAPGRRRAPAPRPADGRPAGWRARRRSIARSASLRVGEPAFGQRISAGARSRASGTTAASIRS